MTAGLLWVGDELAPFIAVGRVAFEPVTQCREADVLPALAPPVQPGFHGESLTARVFHVALAHHRDQDRVVERAVVLDRAQRDPGAPSSEEQLGEVATFFAVAARQPIRVLDDQRRAQLLGVLQRGCQFWSARRPVAGRFLLGVFGGDPHPFPLGKSATVSKLRWDRLVRVG